MTLSRSEDAVRWWVDPPPQIDDAARIGAWSYAQLERLARFLDRPEFPGVVLSQITTNVQPEFKAENGLLVYVGAGVLGPQPGLYIREENVWKKL